MTTHEHGHDHGHQHEHGHGHQHGHGFNAESLRNNDRLYHGVYAEIVGWLDPPQGGSVLEAGSGAGGFTQLLAEKVGPLTGTVTALDQDAEMLEVARDFIGEGAVAGAVTYQQGDMANLPFDAGSFDLVWSSRTVHHLPDQLAAVRELVRVLKPGGWLALREGPIRTRFLPDDIGIGEPGLDDRLDVAFHRWFAANVRGGEGSVRYPFGWTQMLADAGLQDVTAKSFLLEALPPFDDVQISYMGRHLKRWLEDDERRDMLMPGDAEILEQLTDPSSEQFVFGRPDLYLQETVTVYAGRA